MDHNIGPLNSAFWKACQEQGEPAYEIIEVIKADGIDELVSKLNERETYYISQYDSANPDHGYNIKRTGTAGTFQIPKLERMKMYYCAEYWEQVEPIFYSVLQKLDCLGQMTPDEKDLYNEYFVENNVFYDSRDYLNEDWKSFAKCCIESDIEDAIDAFIAENATEIEAEYEDSNTIYQLDNDGNILARFDSQSDAAVAMNAKTAANINNVLMGKQKTAHGYKWCRAKDYQPNFQMKLWD